MKVPKMEEREEDKRFSLFRRKSTKKEHNKQFGGSNAVGERLSAGARSATLPSQPYAQTTSGMTQSPSGGLFSKLKRRFRLRSSKGKYDFKDFEDKPPRLRRKSDDPVRGAEQEELETATVAKVTSSVKTPRRCQNDKENVILIRKDKCVSVICQDADGGAEVIFSNMPPGDEEDDFSESWGEGSEEDPYATINSVKEEIKEKFSGAAVNSDNDKLEKDRARAKELLQHSMAVSNANNASNGVPPGNLECVNVEDLYAKINSKTKNKKKEDKKEDSGLSETQSAEDFNKFVKARVRSRLEHEYETLEDVKQRASELFDDKIATSPVDEDEGNDSNDEFEIEPDYETLEDVRRRISTVTVPDSPAAEGGMLISPTDNKEICKDTSPSPSALTSPVTPTTTSATAANTMGASATSKTSPSGGLAPLAISIDSTLPTEEAADTTSSTDCLYDNPNIILRKQFFRYSLGATLSPYGRHSLVLPEPSWAKKTPAEEELVEKLSSQLAPPLPLRNYQKEEVGKSFGSGGGSRHSWSSLSTKFWDMSESWHGGTEVTQSSCVPGKSLETMSKSTVRSKSQDFSDDSKGNTGSLYSEKSAGDDDEVADGGKDFGDNDVNEDRDMMKEKLTATRDCVSNSTAPLSKNSQANCSDTEKYVKVDQDVDFSEESVFEEVGIVENSFNANANNACVTDSSNRKSTVLSEATLILSSSLSHSSNVICEKQREIEIRKINTYDKNTETTCSTFPCSEITPVACYNIESPSSLSSHISTSCSKPSKDIHGKCSTMTVNDDSLSPLTDCSNDPCSNTTPSIISTSAAQIDSVSTKMSVSEVPSQLFPVVTTTPSGQTGGIVNNGLPECGSSVDLESQEGLSRNLGVRSERSYLPSQFSLSLDESSGSNEFDGVQTREKDLEDKACNENEIKKDRAEVSFRQKDAASGTHEWAKKRRSGPNASPFQDMAEISKAFEHEEFLSGFTEQYNAEDGSKVVLPDDCERFLFCGVSAGESMEHNGNVAPLCGCENDNDCICVDDVNLCCHDDSVVHPLGDVGAAAFTDTTHFLTNEQPQEFDVVDFNHNFSGMTNVDVTTENSNSHHIHSSAISTEEVNWEEFISPPTYNLKCSSGHNSELSTQHTANQKLFLQMTRLLENVINGFCQGRLAIEMYYVLAGVFKWARCFNLRDDEFKMIEDKMKRLLLTVRGVVLSKWSCLDEGYEEEREKMQSGIDSCYQRIRTLMKSLEGLPAFLDVRLNLMGSFLFQYEVKHVEKCSKLHRSEALRISQQELSFVQWALNSGIWAPRYVAKKDEEDKMSGEELRGAVGGIHNDAGVSRAQSSVPSREPPCTFSSSLLPSPLELSPSESGKLGFSMAPNGILYEFLNMCDTAEDESDDEDENETIDTYIRTVAVPIAGSIDEDWSVYDSAAILSLCRAFHGELAYMCKVRPACCKAKPPKEMNTCTGRRSHLSNSDWEEMDRLMKKLVPHISPRLDFQFLLRTYSEFKFFILKGRQRNARQRNCFLMESEEGLRCCRKEEMVFLKLLRDELRHFAGVIRQSTASESLFVEDKDVGFSVTTILRISLTTLKKMKFPQKPQTKSKEQSQSSTRNFEATDLRKGAGCSFDDSDESVDEGGACCGDLDPEASHLDLQDIQERHEEITPKTKVEFHIENYKRFRAGHMWTDLDSWHSPEAFRDDPNVIDLRMGKSFFVDCDTNVMHSNCTSWGVYEEPKPLHEREDFLESMQQLQLKEWYWGPLSYEQAAAVLRGYEDGSFLVRDSSDRKYLLSLSFKSLGEVYHTRIEHAKGLFSFWSQPDSHGKARICEFIEKSVQNSHDGRFLYFLSPMDLGSPPLPIRLLNPVSRNFRIPSLRHLSRFIIRQTVRRDHIDFLPVPLKVKSYLRQKQFYVEFRGNERWTFEEENNPNEA